MGQFASPGYRYFRIHPKLVECYSDIIYHENKRRNETGNTLHFILRNRKSVSPSSTVIKLFSCSTQLSMKFSLLINMKMPTIVGIFIFFRRENFMHSNV